MTHYHQCTGCAVSKDTCKRRASLKTAMAGLSITSVKFKCTDRTALFSAGQRITFSWGILAGQDEDGEGVYDWVKFNGTIICEASRPNRFTVRVDATGEGYTHHPKDVFRDGADVINVKSSSITLLDEPIREFCAICLKYEGEAGRCQADPTPGWGWLPDGCMDHPSGKRGRAI